MDWTGEVSCPECGARFPLCIRPSPFLPQSIDLGEELLTHLKRCPVKHCTASFQGDHTYCEMPMGHEGQHGCEVPSMAGRIMGTLRWR